MFGVAIDIAPKNQLEKQKIEVKMPRMSKNH